MKIQTIHAKWPGEGESVTVLAIGSTGVVGQLIISDWQKATPYLWQVFVLPQHRRRGVGKMLVDHAVSLAAKAGKPSLSLWAKKTNAKAIKLYRSRGFALARDDDPQMYVLPLKK